MKRFLYVTITMLLYSALVFPTACEEMSKIQLPDAQNGRRNPDIPMLNTPPENNVQVPNRSSECATDEFRLSCEEDVYSTDESELATIEVVFAKRNVKVLKSLENKRDFIETVKIGAQLVVLSRSSEGGVWLRVNTGNKIGYVNELLTCPSQICIEELRSGVVSLYVQSKNMNVPQIQFRFTNLLENDIRSLKVSAQFYYKGELVGEDEGFVAADIVGIKSLKSGQSNDLFFRPYYEVPQQDLLSPENPVTVKLFCAIEGFRYIPCGQEYKIESMLY